MEKKKTSLEIMQEMCNDDNQKVSCSNSVIGWKIDKNIATVTFQVSLETVINIQNLLVCAYFIDKEEFAKYENKEKEEIIPEEKVKRITDLAKKWMENRDLKSDDEKREFKNGFHTGYIQGTLDDVEIALKKFCELKCGDNCEQPFCENKMEFRRELKQHLL